MSNKRVNPFKLKLHLLECEADEKDKKIADLEAKLAESEERLKTIDNFKENYGYSNYEDAYILEDLQSRAFQAEDDTTVVNKLLDYFNISDENEILPTIKQQLAEKQKEIDKLKRVAYADLSMREIVELKIPPKDQDKISFAVEKLEKVKEFNIQQVFSSKPLDNFIDNQIKQLKEKE